MSRSEVAIFTFAAVGLLCLGFIVGVKSYAGAVANNCENAGFFSADGKTYTCQIATGKKAQLL